MTLIYELALDVWTIYLHTKMNFLAQGFQKLQTAVDDDDDDVQ